MLVLTHKHPFNASHNPTVPHYDVVSYLTHLDPQTACSCRPVTLCKSNLKNTSVSVRLILIPQVLDLPDDQLPCETTLIATDLLVTMVAHEVAPFMTAPKVSD